MAITEQQLSYAAGSQQKRLQPAGGFTAAQGVEPVAQLNAPPAPASAKPPSPGTSNNAPPAGGSAGTPAPFDLNADPVLQQVQAQMASSNSQAQSGALSQEEQALLQLGDPALARSILGQTDPMIAAITNNPESQYSQLGRQYGQNVANFGETLDPSLVDSGYRVQQEGQMAQTYQDALAQAASGFQNQYQQIQQALQQTEAQNAGTLSQAYSDAYNRALQEQLANASVVPTGTSLSSILSALGSG